MPVLLRNNATATLAGAVDTTQTTLSVNAGQGEKFPSPTGGDWFPLTLERISGGSVFREIVHCTARSGDTLTVTRAQEGTAADSFDAGDRAGLRFTQAAYDDIKTWLTSLGDSLTTLNGTVSDPETGLAQRLLKSANLGDLVDKEAARNTLNAVGRTAADGAAMLPVGNIASRPADAAGLVRFNSETGVFEGSDGGKWDSLGEKPPVGMIQFFQSRSIISAGYIAYDGQELSRATYPDHYQFFVDAGLIIPEATWQADPTKRGMASDGDGSTTYRVPDFNGKSAGSLGAVYLTGDGHKTAGVAGTIREDEMQQITGSAELPGASITDTDGAISSFETTSTTIGGTGSSTTRGFDFDSANSPGARTNTYTHGTDVSGVWCGRAFGAVVNVGSADAAQLASDYANLAGLVSALDADKLDKVNAIAGEGYQWHDETANRSFGVEYTNSRGKPISVAIRIPSVGSALPVEVSHDGVTWVNLGITSTNSALFYCFEVPDGHLYRINNSFLSWSELY